jgi:hypothetical protein
MRKTTKSPKAETSKWSLLTLNKTPTTTCKSCGQPCGITWDTQYRGVVHSFCRGEHVELYIKSHESIGSSKGGNVHEEAAGEGDNG